MRKLRSIPSPVLALTCALCAPALLGAGEAEMPSEPPKAKVAPKPEVRNWTVNKNGYSFTFTFEPGIAMPGKVAEVKIQASKIPDTPHPQFGNRIPLKGARIAVEFVNPAGESIGNFKAHPLPLRRGHYGLHVTPNQGGVYEVWLRGKTAKGKALEADLKMPVDVWPLPKELQGSGADSGGKGTRRVIRRPIISK